MSAQTQRPQPCLTRINGVTCHGTLLPVTAREWRCTEGHTMWGSSALRSKPWPADRADHKRHVLVGDLDALEAAIVQYIWQWGQHLDGVHEDTIAGTPVAAANMAMTVIRKNLAAEPALVPWFARLRARIFGQPKSVVSGSNARAGDRTSPQ